MVIDEGRDTWIETETVRDGLPMWLIVSAFVIVPADAVLAFLLLAWR